MPYAKVFLVADNESEIRFSKFKIADPIWRCPQLTNRFNIYQTQSDNLKCLTIRFFWIVDNESETRFSKFKMTDPT